MISQNIISPICVEKGKRQSRQTAVNVKARRKRKIDQVVNCCRSVFPPQWSIHLFRDQGFQRENGVELINSHILAVLVKAKNLRITIQVISCLQEKLPALETEFWTLYVQCYKLQPCIYVTCPYKTSQFGAVHARAVQCSNAFCAHQNCGISLRSWWYCVVGE